MLKEEHTTRALLPLLLLLLSFHTSDAALSQQKLSPGDIAAGAELGAAMSLSEGVVLTGATGAGAGGEAYLFARDEGGPFAWGLRSILSPSGLSADAEFGASVSLSSSHALVGAPYDDANGTDAGLAVLFSCDDASSEWTELRRLSPAGPAEGENYGASVSIFSDLALVGAPRSDAAGASSGAAYLFRRDEGGTDAWGQMKQLTAVDALAGDMCGWSVAVSDSLAVMGAPFEDGAGSASGAVYLFGRNTGGTDNWGQMAKLVPADAAEGDRFGWSVALSGDYLVVGAPTKSDVAANQGAAYVFFRSQGGTDGWGQVAKLVPGEATEGRMFGMSVALSDSCAVVGAPSSGPTPVEGGGRAYVFVRQVGRPDTWDATTVLSASDGFTSDQFGAGVAVEGSFAAVGAPADGGGAYLSTIGPLPPELILPDVICNAGDSVVVSIRATMHDFQSASLAFTVDPASVESVRLRAHAFEFSDSALGDANLHQDTVFVGLSSDTAITLAADTLAQLVIRIRSLATGSSFPLKWAIGQTFLGDDSVPMVDGSLSVANLPPFWAATEDIHAVAGAQIRRTVTASDPEGLPLVYSAPVMPSDASFDAASGEFVWNTALTQRGDTVVVFRVTDGVSVVDDTLQVYFATGYGDVTDDGTISTLDAAWVLQYYVRTREVINRQAADVSDNGLVTAHDAALILEKVAHPSFVFPVEEPAAEKPVPAAARRTWLELDGDVWVLMIDEAADVVSGGLILELPPGCGFTGSAGVLSETGQTGGEGRMGFVRHESDEHVLARLSVSDGSCPKIVHMSLNEGAIAVRLPSALGFSMAQNVPNPFNPSTSLVVSIPEEGPARLVVYDINGRMVRALVDGPLAAGVHRFVWDGRDSGGRAAASGVYIARLDSRGQSLTRLMTLVR